MKGLAITLALLGVCYPTRSPADVGAYFVRVKCSIDTNQVELEPLIVWNEGEPPYWIAFDQWDKGSMTLLGVHRFYSYGFNDRHFISTSCNTTDRVIRIFVTDQQELTVVEAGKVIVEAMEIADGWRNSDAIYMLKSPRRGVWDECFGWKSEGYEELTCGRFDSRHPNNCAITRKSLQKAGTPHARLLYCQPDA